MTVSSLKEGDSAPNICLQNESSEKVCLKELRGKWVVFYFYPKDNSPGCKQEAVDFSNRKELFEKNGAVVIGVSKDTTVSHQKFIEKAELSISLWADPELIANKAFDVWRLKKFMGKESMGTVRTTFLIRPDGKIAKVWNNVRVKDHVESVLKELVNQKNE